ncbi:peptidase S8/S53 domain-containing protein [Cercophora samala]|uniref:Peptidase S8/S53 domain-containing protein n=1 Tax=Cercophora samala TaxID=330535 RepID=A0AA40DAM9_9PEZI|nr:peptidase S8/S53 domain-containing protein [Cercophora samala]
MLRLKVKLAYCWLLECASLSTTRALSAPISRTIPTISSRSLEGVKSVEELVQKAQRGSVLKRRETEFTVHPLITTISPRRIAQLVERATVLNPNYAPTDFGTWYQVLFQVPVGEDGQTIVDLLAELSGYQEVTSCHPLSGTSLPSVDPSNDPLFSGQGYMTPAGQGINAPYAWGFPGGDGTNTTVIDIQRGVEANITLLGGLNVKDRYQSNYRHGTAVLGEMLMVENDIGGVGIIPGAQGHVVGVTRVVGGAPFENYPEAILDAVGALGFGDAMLLEIQVSDVNGNMFPMEIIDAVYDVISLATSLGITVIEPAGNGQQDLDAPIQRIGSAAPASIPNPSNIPRTRVPESNYGARIDVHSWGENILTASGIGSGEDIDTYLPFDGTSGAAPIIAGAALSVQGMVSANRGAKLDAFALRNLIKMGATSTSNPSIDKIGVQPDLRALIDGGHLFPAQRIMKPQAILSALAGSYELLNITRNRANDSVEIPTPQNPYAFTGLLIYTSSGYMSAHMTSFNVSDLPDNGANMVWPPQNYTELDDAWAVVAKTTLVYAGALSINPEVPSNKESGAVIHGPLHVTSTPAWIGGTQRRNYRVVKRRGRNGGTFLRLSAPINSDATVEGTLWWRKLD